MNSVLFEGHYSGWRETRIAKLVRIMGSDWFPGKSVLELGAAYGHIGKRMVDLGCSTVVCAEGRAEHIERMKQLHPEVTPLHLDLDSKWDLSRQFDLVIHWGVMYHLDDWKDSLARAIQHAPFVCLETEVSATIDPTFDIKVGEFGFDQALNGTGSRPSPAHIEATVMENGATYERYDHSDINFAFHLYDWDSNDGKWEHGRRRFWMIRR